MLELTKGGATERQIAQTLGVSRGLVHREIKRVLEELARTHSGTADDVRLMQMERYVSLLARWWPLAISGDERATNMVLRIMSRIDQINGIIPNEPLISMTNQTLQLGEGIGLMELAKVVANGNGSSGTYGPSSDDSRESDAVLNGSIASEPVPETTGNSRGA